MKVYLDIVLLENFIMNYIIIFSTAIISKSRIRYFRIFLASFLASLYSILNYTCNFKYSQNFFIKIIISILIVFLVFESYRIKIIFKQLILFYLVSFTFGGIVFMLLFLINPSNIKMKEGFLIGTYPVKVTILGGIIGFFVICCVSFVIKDRLRKKSMLCDLEIFYKGKYKKIKTMIDTGNLLKEPISQKDVIIVEKNSLKEIVSSKILDNIDNILYGKWIDAANDVHSYHFKLIPFTSLGNENGLLIGFEPDFVKIINDEEYIRDDVIIGIYNAKLSKSNLYTSLIGLDILTNRNAKEHSYS